MTNFTHYENSFDGTLAVELDGAFKDASQWVLVDRRQNSPQIIETFFNIPISKEQLDKEIESAEESINDLDDQPFCGDFNFDWRSDGISLEKERIQLATAASQITNWVEEFNNLPDLVPNKDRSYNQIWAASFSAT